MENDANVNATDRWGGTPMRDALREGHFGVAKELRDNGGRLEMKENDVSGEVCTGWCVLQWYRRFSPNLGQPIYRRSGELLVPVGRGAEVATRRGGRWYLGVQALETVAEYSIVTSSRAPQTAVELVCSRLSHYCPSAFRQYAVTSGAVRRQPSTAWAWAAALTAAALLGGAECTRGRGAHGRGRRAQRRTDAR